MESPKERAENLMIVDLLRNDLGRVCCPGSITVPSLFQVETLETLYQMTSTVTGTILPGTGICDIFRALFPCGSITGAPKTRTMEIIRDLESAPRGVYTGAIGFLSPGGEAVFSVPIRMAVIDTVNGTGEIGIGGGVTWDSDPDKEYREALAKSRFAETRIPDFRLIETLLWEEGTGFFLLDRHLRRLAASARYFGFVLDKNETELGIAKSAAGLLKRSKVRLLLDMKGRVEVEVSPLPELTDDPVPTAFATERVDSSDRFLYHKTTNRALFAGTAGMEKIFVNERGEVTESDISNVVALIHGELVTPPVSSGLLPGVFREDLLECGIVAERVLTPQDLIEASAVFLVNSVRKWRRACLDSEDDL